MAQNIKIELLCDACKAHDIHNDEAETLPAVSLNQKAPLFIDLCEPHRKELYDPLADLLARNGRSEDGKRRRRKKAKAAEPAPEPTPEPKPAPEPKRVELASHTCPTCSRTFNTDQGMRTHHTRVHGNQLPKEAAGQEQLTSEFVCPTCGKDDFASPSAQAVSMHRVRAHGYRKGDDEAAA